jgi:hypothetical protein
MDHDGALGGAGLEVVADVAAATGLAGGAVDPHRLPVEVDVADRHGHGLFPAQPGEGQHDRHVAKARLEGVERGGEPDMLGLQPSRSPLRLVEAPQQLPRRIQPLGRPLDLPLEHRVP